MSSPTTPVSMFSWQSGGTSNHVQGDQHNVHDNTTNNVQGDHNTYYNSTTTNHHHDRSPVDLRKPLSVLLHHAAPNAMHNSEIRHPPPKCHPDTRLEVLEKLSAWIRRKDRSKHSRVFWVYGTVGVGKSAIAQTLCEKFSQADIAADFFFSRNDATRNNTDRFVATIAYQLAQSRSQSLLGRFLVKRAIKAAVKRKHNALGWANMESAFEELVLRPCLAVPSFLRGFSKGVMVIDGLDECLDINSQERLLSFICDVIAKNPSFPIDFLLFSRPEVHITNFFNRILSQNGVALDRLGITDCFQTDRDIETYLNARFSEIVEKYSGVMQNVPMPWPGTSVVAQLVHRASGQFIYATTVTKYIDDHHALPHSRLQEILDMQPVKPSPYAELDLLYHQILSNCRNVATVIQILQVVLESGLGVPGSDEPWFVAQILGLDEETIHVTLSGLHSVLDVPKPNERERIRLYHSSFSDYLRDPERSGEFAVPPLCYDLRSKITLVSNLMDIRSKYHLPQSWPSQKSISQILERAGGETAYIQTLLPYLDAEQPEERLAALLDSVPGGSTKEDQLLLLYHHVVRVYKDEATNILSPMVPWLPAMFRHLYQQCHDTSTAQRILRLVLDKNSDTPSAGEPWFIAQVLDLEQEVILRVLSNFSSVIHLPDHGNEHDSVWIYHSSFSDYLREEFLVPPLPYDLQSKATLVSSLEDIRSKHHLPQSWPSPTYIAQVLGRAGGETAYMQTLLRYLDAEQPRERLAALLDSEPSGSTKEDQLLLLYHHVVRVHQDRATDILTPMMSFFPVMFRHLFQQCQDISTVQKILRLMLDKSGELWFIAQVLDLEEEVILRVLAGFSSVIHIPDRGSEHDSIRIYHSSFLDYLREARTPESTSYVPPLPDDVNLKMALVSKLNYLRRRRHLPTSWPGRAVVDGAMNWVEREPAVIQALAGFL
ncbi:hypothetical protein VNI00_005946 [Paramarasmius palmivorus]|uniref:Nephrocystin 3-like N-terminal domain-containing protein n=1 Tax=Paramarasmius palmivorus TaxID=297713 RepID=A0AAW0DAQ2_9AGAR